MGQEQGKEVRQIVYAFGNERAGVFAERSRYELFSDGRVLYRAFAKDGSVKDTDEGKVTAEDFARTASALVELLHQFSGIDQSTEKQEGRITLVFDAGKVQIPDGLHDHSAYAGNLLVELINRA